MPAHALACYKFAGVNGIAPIEKSFLCWRERDGGWFYGRAARLLQGG
jgi:hypothetical protein